MGNTTYTVKVYFNKDIDKTFKDSVQKLIINECLEKIRNNPHYHLTNLIRTDRREGHNFCHGNASFKQYGGALYHAEVFAYDTLVKNHLQHFDAWASNFGETVTAIELALEGTGYHLKTRFARFYNLSELMKMFREVADIQTADMLNLPMLEVEYCVVNVKLSEMQQSCGEGSRYCTCKGTHAV